MGNLDKLKFNSDDVEPAGSFEPIPEGLYQVVIMDSDVKTTKAGTGEYIEIKLEVLDGDHKGRYLWDRITIENPNAKAVEIGLGQLSALCRAVNVQALGDTFELHNVPLIAKVVQRVRSDNGEMTNEVKAYEPAANKYPAATPDAAKSDEGLPF